MKQIRLALLAFVATGLSITLPSTGWLPAGRDKKVIAVAAPLPLAPPGGANVVGLINQSGFAPDRLGFWHFDDPELLLGDMPVSGLEPGEKIVGMDFDPETESLIGVTNIGKVIRVNLQTAVATIIDHIPSAFTQGTIGFDYDPGTKDLLILSDEGGFVNVNLSRNPLIIVESLPSYDDNDANKGKKPEIAGVTNNKGPGVNTGKTFLIDSMQDVLAMLDPISGKLKTIAPLGVNASSRAGFDAVPGTLFAIAALQLEGEAKSRLYRINLINGTMTEIGPLGGDSPVADLAVPLSSGQDEITCEVNPADAENFVGETHAFKVIVKKNGKPLVGAIVLMGILDGPNTGVGANGQTKDNPETEEQEAEAEFSYQSNGKPGLDTISVSVIAEDKIVDCKATKLWKIPNLTISEVQVKSKKLTVVGCCFQPGDKIFVNDIEQKTKNDSDAPEMILIAKKGAKKLKACSDEFVNRVFVRRLQPGQPVQDTQAFATCP